MLRAARSRLYYQGSTGYLALVHESLSAVVAVEPLCVPAVLVVHLVCAVRDSAGGLVARARRAVRAAASEDGLDVEEEAAQLLQLAPLRLTPRCHRARQRDVDGRVRHDPRLAARLVEHRGRDEGVWKRWRGSTPMARPASRTIAQISWAMASWQMV